MGKHSKNTINIKARKKDKKQRNKMQQDKKPIEKNMSEKEIKKTKKRC